MIDKLTFYMTIGVCIFCPSKELDYWVCCDKHITRKKVMVFVPLKGNAFVPLKGNVFCPFKGYGFVCLKGSP